MAIDAKTLLDRMNSAEAPTGIYLGDAYAECLAAVAHKLSTEELDKLVNFGAVIADIVLIPHMGVANGPGKRIE